MSRTATPFILIVALSLTMMLGPFSMDTYLPAFPNIGENLRVDQQSVSLSVSVYIFSMAFSQLFGGAFSDRYGRKRILLSGLVLYILATLMIAGASTLTIFLAGRAAQAVGAGWVLVTVPAVVRDRVSGREAAKLFSMMGFIMVIAPGIAPSVGSAILQLGSWRVIFLAMAIYGLLLIPLGLKVIFRDDRTLVREQSATGMWQRYKDVFGVNRALPFIVWQTATFSVIMIFITYASFIYQEHFEQTETQFSLLFAANIVMMLVFNIANRVLLSRYSSLKILRLATTAQALGIVLLLIATFGKWGVYGFLPAMMLTIGSMGAIMPNSQACFLDYYPRSAGTAAALLGAAQFGISGLLSALSTLLPHTLPTVILAMATCTLISTLVLCHSLFLRRAENVQELQPGEGNEVSAVG